MVERINFNNSVEMLPKSNAVECNFMLTFRCSKIETGSYAQPAI